MPFSAAEYVSGFSHTGGKITDLSRIAGLLDRLGNPQNGQRFVHIAGTNGKGSTLEYMSRILIEAGYKTGQFTSPFVEKYNDRIRINGKNIPDRILDEIAVRVKNAVSGQDYSQFEISLAIAFLYFKEEKCDIVFLEAGIGGLLDATNIIDNPCVSVITSISLDHTALLGNTVAEITAQKAGIIKKNCPVALAADNAAETVEIVRNTAYERGCSFIMPETDKCVIVRTDIYGSVFTYKNKEYRVNMCGKHQVCNALTAVETAELLRERGFDISDDAIKKGLESAKVMLRAEILLKSPLIIADGGHNISGIDSLISVLKQIDCPIIGVVGMVRGKAADYAGKKLSEIFDRTICADGFIDNCLSGEELKSFFSCPCEAADYKTALRKAIELAKDRKYAVVICGSLYFASAARQEIFREEGTA